MDRFIGCLLAIGMLVLIAHIVLSALGAKKAVPAILRAAFSGLGMLLSAIVHGSFRMLGIGFRDAGRAFRRGFRDDDRG
ncbi:hypothetical protein HY932_03350 [Candidatus Falkowbacteria bacterium]|nr:hypothetical protein [Candidatus Falkowbacteria bacterium]